MSSYQKEIKREIKSPWNNLTLIRLGSLRTFVFTKTLQYLRFNP